jgi:hypothetical protein
MDKSIHLTSKFSSWKHLFNIRMSGGNKMFTKGSHNDTTYSRRALAGQQTSRFANLVSRFKKLEAWSSSSTHAERLEKAIRYTRPVDMGTLIRYR